MLRALAIIPARLGSTRLPCKPLLEIAGKPMIEHTFRRAKSAALLDHVIVTSDSDRVLDVIRAIGGATIRTGACATGTDRVVAALRSLDQGAIMDTPYDVVVNVQGDEPGVNPAHIDACIRALRSDPSAVMSTLATPIRTAPEAFSRNVVKCVTDVHSHALYFSRALIPHSKTGTFVPSSTSPSPVCLRHIGLYAFRTSFLLQQFPSLPPCMLETHEELEQLRVLYAGYKIHVVHVDSVVPGVDTEQDLQAARQILA